MFHPSIRILLLLLLSKLCAQAAISSTEWDYFDNGDSITIAHAPLSAIGDITVPSTFEGKPVSAIGPNAFSRNYEARNIVLPATVSTIGAQAFNGCPYLASINLPETITTIDEGAFSGCSSLSNIILPSGLKRISANTFFGCGKINSITLPDSINFIGEGAFSFTHLSTIEIPAKVTSIGARTFYGCRKIISFIIPPQITSIGDEAFSKTPLVQIFIPSTVESLGKGVFADCKQLTKAVVEAKLRKIEDRMFQYCHKLVTIEFQSGLLEIGESAFEETGIARISLDGVRKIGPSAFNSTPLLLPLRIPASVVSIGDKAFAGHGSWAGVTFQGDAPSLGKGVFEGTASGFKIFVSSRSTGFSIPKWNGYTLSTSDSEIDIILPDGTPLFNNDSTIRFPRTFVGMSSKSSTFIIRSVGNLKLTEINARITGRHSRDFQIKMLPPSSLKPGNATDIEVTFSPKQSGKTFAFLQIASSDAGENPFVIKLTAVGLETL